MNINITFPDLERLVASLGLTIADAVALAGSDESETLIHTREAASYAHTLARFLDGIADGLSGEMKLYQPPEIEKEIEAQVYGDPDVVLDLVPPLRPAVRISGDGAA